MENARSQSIRATRFSGVGASTSTTKCQTNRSRWKQYKRQWIGSMNHKRQKAMNEHSSGTRATVPPSIPASGSEDDDNDDDMTTCEHCNGTGGDPWDDGISPCEACDGEGYKWWL